MKDLDSPDESLFAIAQPTPSGKRLVTENLTETQVRTFLIGIAEVQWPQGKKSPDKSMTVNVLIGRDGRVKEAKTYSRVDNEVEDAALTGVTK